MLSIRILNMFILFMLILIYDSDARNVTYNGFIVGQYRVTFESIGHCEGKSSLVHVHADIEKDENGDQIIKGYVNVSKTAGPLSEKIIIYKPVNDTFQPILTRVHAKYCECKLCVANIKTFVTFKTTDHTCIVQEGQKFFTYNPNKMFHAMTNIFFYGRIKIAYNFYVKRLHGTCMQIIVNSSKP